MLQVNPNIRRDKWTDDEDAKLIELVKTFGVGRWAEIARNCDGRTDQQCMGRWRRHLDPSIKRDSWSPEEDAKLRQLHAQYGTSWSRISKCLKGRTSQQCRARWHQINNGRSRPGQPAGSSSGGSGKQQVVSQQLLQPHPSWLSAGDGLSGALLDACPGMLHV
ncbi:Homeodomain-like protein [Scenedesmus sp. NREL 46B-D3]|nr:Homeodomain-like protein [Scenedesmus sp. NREL 46B-D3]